MVTCKLVTKDVLTDPIIIHVDNSDLNFNNAKKIADQKADELASQPMLLGWYEKKSGRFSPNVECCSEEKPGWIVYAETRGGHITIDINDEAYVFIYIDAGE
ncbi:MAG: AF1514 family protein [Pseudomonadota bacterium]